MTPRQTLFKLCEDLNITVDYARGYVHPRTGGIEPYRITLDPPNGYIFTATGLHTDCGVGGLEGSIKTDWADALRQVKSVLDDGIEKCTDTECEWCADNQPD